MPTVITMSYFFCVDGEEEKTVSVLLNGEESTMSFIDPDSDNVSTKSSFYFIYIYIVHCSREFVYIDIDDW